MIAANKVETLTSLIESRSTSLEAFQLVMPNDGAASEVTEVTVVSHANGTGGYGTSLASLYWTLCSGGNSLCHAVWYDVANASERPVVPNKRHIEVDIVGSDSLGDLATKTASALNSTIYYSATADASVVTVTNKHAGSATNAGAGNTEFDISATTQGVNSAYNGKYLAFASGGASETTHYAWFTATGAPTPSDPAPSLTWTSVPITIVAGDSSTSVAMSTASEIDDLSAFAATPDGSLVDIIVADEGTPAEYELIQLFLLNDLIKVGLVAHTNSTIVQVSPIESGNIWYDTDITINPSQTAGATTSTASSAVYGKRVRLVARSNIDIGSATVYMVVSNY